MRKSLPPGQSQLPQSLQHDFYAQANSLLYYLDFKKCIDEQTAVSTVIENTVESYHSSGQQTPMRPVDQARYQRNHSILETALTASILADQPTSVDALFLAFAWHDLQKAYLLANNIKLSTVLTSHNRPCHAIKIIQELRNTFVHSAENLEQNMTSVAALTAWINRQCAQIDTDQYAENQACNPDQQLKCLLRDAMTQYSQLVSAIVPIAAEPSPGQQDLNHSSSTAFAQQQKSRVVDGSSLCESSTVSKTTADELTARHHGNDNRIGHQHSESKLSIHAKIWTPGLISTAESSSKPSTSG